ncbi:MAG: PSD1 and planctomycete cytochrome C domain-containing protein [Deltaproteobacteria bacterium]|nr:PSD1 and planctomycete cytochrome C domain-containing protein [Deltaproteobacteria bacterium]
MLKTDGKRDVSVWQNGARGRSARGALMVVGTLAGLLLAGPGHAAGPLDFKTAIEPIFEARCWSCHGADAQRGGMRLDVRSQALYDDGVIVPGKPEASSLFRLLVAEDPLDRMPREAPALPADEIERIKRWIEQGAPWPTDAARTPSAKMHWAYVPPTLPPLPKVRRAGWIQTPIDAFVLARLEQAHLSPSRPADRETLIRRVTLDLIGLPPSLAEIDAFLKDRTANAFERVVDRLLASPHYGERWARPWLDLARYADSNGYEKDRLRSIWMYRDWVVASMNANLPFDQFTIEQIAGDLLPGATVQQQIATGFHANTLLNEEGGVDPLEARFEVMVDRVSTTAAVWLGSTLGCAQCHNHKFDPFSARDFFRFMAFFDNTQTITTGDFAGNGRPMGDPKLLVPNEAQARELARLERQMEDVRTRLRQDTPQLTAERQRWMQTTKDWASAWHVLEQVEGRSSRGTRFTKRADHALLATGNVAQTDRYQITATSLWDGPVHGLKLEVLPDPSLPQHGPGRAPNGSFMISRLRVFAAPRKQPQAWQPVPLDEPVDSVGNKTSLARDMLDDDPQTGWSIGTDMGKANLAAVRFVAPVSHAGGSVFRIEIEQESIHPEHLLGCFRLSISTKREAIDFLKLAAPVRAYFDQQPGQPVPPVVVEHHREMATTLRPLRERLAALEKEVDSLNVPSTLVIRESPGTATPRTRFREKGAYTSPGDWVEAATPAILPPLPSGVRADRLALARWLVSRQNPLTARVAVNRAWETFFGRGLVETAEDFGTQGAAPSHPELLDWLAVTFMDGGWDQKAMHKLIVMSATYQQSSVATPTLLKKDPANVLLARSPRFRVEAEMLRDISLAVSGHLSIKRGGPSVFPPQPDGVWEIPYNDNPDAPRWATAAGPDRFRRGLYTFLRRSATYPLLTTFDGSSRQTCTVRRIRTNTPLQALNLLNDKAFLELARGLSERMAAEGGPSLTQRLAHGFRLATGHHARPRELRELLRLYHAERARFVTVGGAQALLLDTQAGSHGPTSAAAVGSIEDQAALLLIANVLLNLDATLSKE